MHSTADDYRIFLVNETLSKNVPSIADNVMLNPLYSVLCRS